jgi:choline dehydrogenase-like flavoprotein
VSAKVTLEGRRATGVAYHQGGASCRRCGAARGDPVGGAFGSPQLLLLSGIGAAPTATPLGMCR